MICVDLFGDRIERNPKKKKKGCPGELEREGRGEEDEINKAFFWLRIVRGVSPLFARFIGAVRELASSLIPYLSLTFLFC